MPDQDHRSFGRDAELVAERGKIGQVRGIVIPAVLRLGTVAMSAKIRRDDVVRALQRSGDGIPAARVVAAAVQKHEQRRTGSRPFHIREWHSRIGEGACDRSRKLTVLCCGIMRHA